MANASREALQQAVKDLYASDEYTDLIITCGTDTHRVHRAIVCKQSEFFKKAERFPAAEGKPKGTIDLPEDDPELVKLYIRYLYEAEYDPPLPAGKVKKEPANIVVNAKGGNYHYGFPHTCLVPYVSKHSKPICPHHTCGKHVASVSDFVCDSCCVVTGPCPTGDANQLLLHAQMYELGDKFDTPSLQALALEKFSRSCHRFWDDDMFARAAHHAFSTTPDNDMGLRDIVTQKLCHEIQIFNKPAIEALVDEFPSLAIGVLKIRAREAAGQK